MNQHMIKRKLISKIKNNIGNNSGEISGDSSMLYTKYGDNKGDMRLRDKSMVNKRIKV